MPTKKVAKTDSKKVAKKPEPKAFSPEDYKKPGLSEKDIMEVKAAFDLFDEDKSGEIDKEELKNAFIDVGVDAKDKIIARFLNDIDKDGSGTIDFQEFIDMITSSMSATDSKEDLEKVFYFFLGDDADSTDQIELKHLKAVSEDLGCGFTDKQLQSMITGADKNKDGKVSFEEFYNIITLPEAAAEEEEQ